MGAVTLTVPLGFVSYLPLQAVGVAFVAGVLVCTGNAEGVGDALVGVINLPIDAVGINLERTATPCPARRATSFAGTPELSHSETAACRRS